MLTSNEKNAIKKFAEHLGHFEYCLRIEGIREEATKALLIVEFEKYLLNGDFFNLENDEFRNEKN